MDLGGFPRRPTQEKLLAEEAEKWVGRARVVSNLEEGFLALLSSLGLGEDLGGF